MREFQLVDTLRSRLNCRRDDTRLGIGDDAAVLSMPAGRELVVTTDTLVSGRHFPEDTSAFDIGYKAIAVNLSDVAAMGATPAWVTVALAAPVLDDDWCQAFVDGMRAACRACPTNIAIDIVGGDTTRSPVLTITITAIGQVGINQAVSRAGARPGDVITVTGTLGDAAAGLTLWPERRHASTEQRWLIERLTQPTLRRGSALVGLAHAAIDISDGLVADLGHILAASGVGARLAIDRLPVSQTLRGLARDRHERRRYQAVGGDDYELCIVLAKADVETLQERLGCALAVVGEIVVEPGLVLEDADGQPVAVEALGAPGWDHFGD